jgi:hypothetical protein
MLKITSAAARALLLGMLAALLLAGGPATAQAVIITAVAAPNLTRPTDGALYPFNIIVSGTYDAGDILAGVAINVTAEYWDEDFFPFADDPIDLTGLLVVPAPGAAAVGAPWGPVAVTFRVGCKVRPEVFGPSGVTGESPMNDGYFRFTTGAGLTLTVLGEWGYNTVTCVAPPLNPTGGNPPAPYPGMTAVPEPGSIMLLASGLAAFARSRRRRR